MASPLRRVEGEVVGSRFLVGYPRDRTHQPLAVMADFVGRGIENHNQPVALLHGGGHTLFQALVVLVGSYHHLVYHHFDVVVLVSVEFHAMHDFTHFAIDADIEVAFLADILEKFLVVSLSGTYQGSQQIDTLSLIVLMNQVENLLFRVLHHLLSRQIGIGNTGTGIKQTEIVVDFGGGAYGRTGILVGGLLFDGNHRAKACNLVHIRTLHASQEIAGIRREGFDVSPLAFRKESIESQRRLSTTAQPRDDGQAIAGNFHIDVLQVMYPGTIYIDIFFVFCHNCQLNHANLMFLGDIFH